MVVANLDARRGLRGDIGHQKSRWSQLLELVKHPIRSGVHSACSDLGIAAFRSKIESDQSSAKNQFSKSLGGNFGKSCEFFHFILLLGNFFSDGIGLAKRLWLEIALTI